MTREADIRAAIIAALEDLDGDRTPLDLVEDIPAIESAVGEVLASRIAAARAQGLSWEAIAQRLGISRQAAHKRFGRGKKRTSGARLELRVERSNKKSK